MAIRDHPLLSLDLVIGSSGVLERYGNVATVARADGFEPLAFVHNVIEGESLICMPKTTGLAIIELATLLDRAKPDLVVTIADRYETLATAIASSYMNIPLAHLQGGEITGSIDEKVRHAVTKLADLHLVATEGARRNVIRMGEDPDSVVLTGCPSIDIAAQVLRSERPLPSALLNERGVGPAVDLSRPFIVVLQHPVTTRYERSRRDILETLNAVLESGLPALWFWPNVDAGSDGTSKGIREFRERCPSAPIRFIKNIPPEDFLALLIKSKVIVGNSSVAIRECSFLGVPAVDVGERQAGRERGSNVTSCPPERHLITAAILSRSAQSHGSSEALYGDGAAGERIAAAIASWTPQVAKRLQFSPRWA